ncbi:uncharacterized protein SCHCODRAFT_02333382 [Schizophyllum commune H4-8]|uniref:uncharacterized protein n=1 Tax=Schizophyllum commune (strain H4-8 / FGSC 9210) TaxID=578458 RepID=UPI00215EFCED|nr:uncharacterized protein SCHCODRAFT_02333382 [Schizophyllum commune H4-8]KAI5889965.1 hypothetical protein SCHCODRAFT_02333382 [Schizophyllum commune H4-8]
MERGGRMERGARGRRGRRGRCGRCGRCGRRGRRGKREMCEMRETRETREMRRRSEWPRFAQGSYNPGKRAARRPRWQALARSAAYSRLTCSTKSTQESRHQYRKTAARAD